MGKQNDGIRKLASKLNPWMLKIEILAILFIALGLGLKEMEFEMANNILVISFQALAIAYFISAFWVGETIAENAFMQFIIRISGIGFSILSIGLLFSVQHYPGADLEVMIGTFTTVILIPVLIYGKNSLQEFNIILNQKLIRACIFGIIGTLMMLNSNGVIAF